MSFLVYICCPCTLNFLCDKSSSLSWQTRSSMVCLVQSASPTSSFSLSCLTSSDPAPTIVSTFLSVPQTFSSLLPFLSMKKSRDIWNIPLNKGPQTKTGETKWYCLWRVKSILKKNCGLYWEGTSDGSWERKLHSVIFVFVSSVEDGLKSMC